MIEIKVVILKNKVKLKINGQTPFMTFINKEEAREFIRNYIEINNIKEIKIINKEKIDL